MTDRDVKAIYDRLPTDLHKRVTVLSKEELAQEFLYHISYDKKIRAFTPYVSRRILDSEDNRIPRICTSPSLAGCIAGEDSSTHIFTNRDFDGVFQIYGLEFDYALKPNTDLVADATQTTEYWLITYSEQTEKYVPVKLGQFYYRSVTQYRYRRIIHIDLLLHVDHNDGLYLTKDTHVNPGYYRIKAESPIVERKKSNTRKPFAILEQTEITKDEYNKLSDDKETHSMESRRSHRLFDW